MNAIIEDKFGKSRNLTAESSDGSSGSGKTC